MRILLFLLVMRLCVAADFTDFDKYQSKLSRTELEEKLALFLKKDARIDGYFELTDEALNVYSALPTNGDRALEYTLKIAPASEVKQAIESKKSLVGMRIAIDPGHFGGPFCHVEERYIDIPPSLGRESSSQFDEGTLSYLTASYLKVLLEKEGAIVFLTRSGIGEGGLPLSFFDWLKENPKFWSPDATLRKLFKYYNQADLHARAEKINAFEPDLSIVIHFNSHHGKDQNSSNSSVTPSNFNMVFLPGAFMSAELVDRENRYEFMRLLVSDDLRKSLRLCQTILSKFTENLCVPVVAAADGARYLDNACLKIEEGIYARNLALTRLIHGPVCYGETLIQNNIDECVNLSRSDFVISGVTCSSRIKQVAEAYFEGIKDYIKSSM